MGETTATGKREATARIFEHVPWLLFPISVIGSLVLGLIRWYAIEKPFIGHKHAKLAKLALA